MSKYGKKIVDVRVFRHFFDRSIHRKVKVEKVKPGKRAATEIRPRKNTRAVHVRAGIEGWKKANNTLKPERSSGCFMPSRSSSRNRSRFRRTRKNAFSGIFVAEKIYVRSVVSAGKKMRRNSFENKGGLFHLELGRRLT